MKKKITIYVEGKDYEDLEAAISLVAKKVGDTFISGHDGAYDHDTETYYGYEFHVSDSDVKIEGSPEREDEKFELGII